MREKEEARESPSFHSECQCGMYGKHDALTYKVEGANKGICFIMETQR